MIVIALKLRRLNFMQNIELEKVYKHYKGGRYLVLHLVEESTNARKGEYGVTYVSLTYGTIKHRDLKEFIEKVEWPDGTKQSRFILENSNN